jgi:predicted lipoprotein with Yx(FWY)xxD motif
MNRHLDGAGTGRRGREGIMFSASDRTGARLRLGLVLAAPALLVAACGGSSGSTAAHSASTKAVSSSSRAARVETRSGNLGTFLTDGSGRTLYLFAADHGGTSSCTGGCASAWPPLTTTGKPTAGGQVRTALLGTTGRGGGSPQVTYAGHPLYYFAGDSASGDTKGQGLNGFGAKWWVVSPAGTPVTHSPGSGTPSGGSGGYGTGGGAYG